MFFMNFWYLNWSFVYLNPPLAVGLTGQKNNKKIKRNLSDAVHLSIYAWMWGKIYPITGFGPLNSQVLKSIRSWSRGGWWERGEASGALLKVRSRDQRKRGWKTQNQPKDKHPGSLTWFHSHGLLQGHCHHRTGAFQQSCDQRITWWQSSAHWI